MRRYIKNGSEFITHGPFTWERRESDGDLCWVLCHDKLMREPIPGLTFLALAWRSRGLWRETEGFYLCSGGPYDEAGVYPDIESAVRGVTLYVVAYYLKDAQRRLDEAMRLQKALNPFVTMLKNEQKFPRD